MYYLQKLYSLIFNPVFSLTSKIDERVRNAGITLCCLFLTGFFIAYFDRAYTDLLYRHHGQNNIICGSVMFILILLSIKDPLKKVIWDRCIFTLMFLAGAGLVVIRFIHPTGTGYRSFGLMLMFFYPLLYYVWNNRGDYNLLFSRLSAATAVTGILFYIRVAHLALNGDLRIVAMRVTGTLHNANMFSMIGMVMICASTYMFLVNRSSKIWFVLSALSFGIGWSIVLMGVSRLSILVGAGSMFSFVVFWLKTKNTFTAAKSLKICFIRFSLVLITAILMVFVGNILLDINTEIAFQKYNEASMESGSTEYIDQAEEDATDQKDVSSAADRFSAEGKDLDGYTAGRINIWKRYAEHLNMIGNDMDQVDFKELTGTSVRHAHNNFLEYGFRCGVPVAVIHLLVELYAGIVCLIFLFGKKYTDPCYLFAVVFMVCYTVESLFDIATVPFERHAPFYFYILLMLVFGRKQDLSRHSANATVSSRVE